MEYENNRLLHRKQFLGELVQECYKSKKMNRQEYIKKMTSIRGYTDTFEIENDIVLFKALANKRDNINKQCS